MGARAQPWCFAVEHASLEDTASESKPRLRCLLFGRYDWKVRRYNAHVPSVLGAYPVGRTNSSSEDANNPRACSLVEHGAHYRHVVADLSGTSWARSVECTAERRVFKAALSGVFFVCVFFLRRSAISLARLRKSLAINVFHWKRSVVLNRFSSEASQAFPTHDRRRASRHPLACPTSLPMNFVHSSEVFAGLLFRASHGAPVTPGPRPT